MTNKTSQQAIDDRNATFWDELCGSGLAQMLGITEITPENLARFDQAYMDLYPYLPKYVDSENVKGKKTLEIGLGFGTLGQYIASKGADYYGLDIAEGPVAMMLYRLENLGVSDPTTRVQTGSALENPHPDVTFDYVYTIGCLHHTGNLPKSIGEVHRVLRPGGKAIIMLYNRHSLRQLVVRFKDMFAQKRKSDEEVRGMYDKNTTGEAAPHTDYVSRRDVRRLMSQFSTVSIGAQNMDPIVCNGKVIIKREHLLTNLARVLGLDLYIVAQK